MAEPPELQIATPESCRAEYDIVAASWRFFSSLRFIVVAFTITLHSALFTLYNQSITRVNPTNSASGVIAGHKIPAFIIPLIGLLTLAAILIVERRTVALFRIMIKRGTQIERRLAIFYGHFQRLSEDELVHPRGIKRAITHTWGILFFYYTLACLWLLAFVMQLFPSIS